MEKTSKGLLGLFSNRNYLSLYLASFISSTGSTVTMVTLSWLVYQQTHNALDIAYLAAASAVPTLSFGLFSGVIADRFSRKRLMILADLVRAATIASLISFLYFVGFNLPFILLSVVVVAAFNSIFMPASNSLIPQIVRQEQFESANGFLAASNSAAQSLGSAVGGVIIAISGALLGLFYNSITYVISASFLSMLIVKRSAGSDLLEKAGKSVIADLREGFSYLRKHIPVLELTIGFIPGNFFFVMVTTYIVAYSYNYFQGNAGIYGYLLASLTAGVAIGSIVVSRMKPRKFAGKIMVASVAVQGIAVVGLYLTHLIYLNILSTLVMGLGIGFINTVYFSAVQSIVPNELLGRVLGIDIVGSFAAIPLGQIAGGILTESFGVLMNFLIAGIGLLLEATFLYSLKGVRKMTYGEDLNS